MHGLWSARIWSFKGVKNPPLLQLYYTLHTVHCSIRGQGVQAFSLRPRAVRTRRIPSARKRRRGEAVVGDAWTGVDGAAA